MGFIQDPINKVSVLRAGNPPRRYTCTHEKNDANVQLNLDEDEERRGEM